MPLPTVNFSPANTIVPRKSFLRLIPAIGALAAAGVFSTGVFTATGHNLVNGQAVRLTITTGLTGLTSGTVYYVRDVATNTFKLSATATISGTTVTPGAAIAFTADGSGTVTKVVDLVGKSLSYKQTLETIKREVPDADGILRPDREVVIKRMQDFEFETEEIAALPAAFGQVDDVSGNLTGGSAQVYSVDPDDAANKAAIVSSEFLANWKLADGFNLNAGEITKAKIVIGSLEKVVLKIDGAV